MKVLEGLYYTKDHEWVKVEGDQAYIGITDYAQHHLGNIVYVDLPEADTEFSAGDTFGVVESVKAASDIFIPVDGTVVEANQALVDAPELLNQDAFENWMIKITLTNKAQLDELLDAEAYKKHCEQEE